MAAANFIFVVFDPDIAYGDLTDLDAWIPRSGAIELQMLQVSISSGIIVIRYTTFPGPANSLEFVGPPPVFRDVDNGILRSFISPVPFP